MDAIFNEAALRKEIAKTWGEYGGHMDVYDTILNRLETAEKTLNRRTILLENIQDKLAILTEESNNPSVTFLDLIDRIEKEFEKK
jgi:hypothetical protein